MESAAAEAACINAGLDKDFCESQGQRVYRDCLTRACGVKSKALTSEQVRDGLSAFLLELQEKALAEDPDQLFFP